MWSFVGVPCSSEWLYTYEYIASINWSLWAIFKSWRDGDVGVSLGGVKEELERSGDEYD